MTENKLFAYTLALITFVMALSFTLAANAERYPLTAIVTENDNGVITCVDYRGEGWVFDDGIDWEIDDVLSILMDDNDTETIYDDKIVSVFYGGHLAR